MTGAHVELRKAVRTWAPGRASIVTWTNAALGRRASNREIGVRVVGRAESRRLNARYRGKDHPTNVLSFPAAPLPAFAPDVAEPTPLGDLVVCPQVLHAEAREQGKSLRAHWAHLVVHGALHLIGYDHERDSDARRMERREIAVLKRLGFTNPYRATDRTSRASAATRRPGRRTTDEAAFLTSRSAGSKSPIQPGRSDAPTQAAKTTLFAAETTDAGSKPPLRPGRSDAPRQAAKTTLFAAANAGAVSKKSPRRFLPMN